MEAYMQRVVEAKRREVELEISRSGIGRSTQIVPPLADLIMDSCGGARVDGKLDGPCRAVFKDGHCYEGDFEDGVMHGVGKFSWTDRLIYEGDMERSKITGRGTYTWPDGSTYSGSVVNGIRHGYGVYYSPITKTTYSGQWVNGKREGKGHLTYSRGSEDVIESESYYDGDWSDNRQHGAGVRRYRSGNEYRGEWREGVKEGEGEMVWFGGRERYKGNWVNNSPNGHGVYIWQSLSTQNHAQHPVSNRYEGEWKNGLRHGHGTFYYASGAVYKGEWAEGLKEGRGTFTFKNGESFTGTFHRDRVSYRESPSTDLPAEEEVLLRPKTPLGTLIGDAGGAGEKEISSKDEFSVCLSPLLSTLDDPHTQLNQVHSVILQHMGQLKRIYHFYSNLGSESLQPSHSLSRLQFWQLLKDCRVHYEGLSIWEADTVAASQPPCPTSCLLMREFLQSLVLLSHHMFSGTISGGVASCFSHFMTKVVLPNACSLTGIVFTTVHSPSLQQQKKCWTLYQSMAHTPNEGALCITMRDLLLRFKERGLIPDLVTAGEVVKAIVQDQPLAVNQQDYNLDTKMTVLGVLETVSRCCQVMSCDQSHDTFNKSDKLSVSRVLNCLIGCRMNLTELNTD